MIIVPGNKHARRFDPLTLLRVKLHDGRENSIQSHAEGVPGPSCKGRAVS